jgi:hypothetical protein
MTAAIPLAVLRKMTVKELLALRETPLDHFMTTRLNIEIARRMDRIPINLPHREDTTT